MTPQEKEVVDRFQQLPPERQRYVMLVMLRTDPDRWRRYQTQGEEELGKLAAEKGLKWSDLNDEQRREFVDELAHGGRS